ncbi:hypothetical protein FNF27_07684 [Cafeteria roenbergensis]|uniref:Mitochondrial fission process protein 1 n=1 Tax=Cafeteria roenbergensis TaxID=33653 RepID=A0A5A8CP37_CAFRO|nr:hypothetical protein FNF29_05713 [Cafeteria roenbergensis]KAA0154214.1 hypothetical protein FNF31_06351 [Cafeteria roenbergensis]KAA0158014.1 hypothetical protein FNF28_06437 [Cafeteria roenbergensis]KAA0165193.1 hypothetical protein FNF27_07684 [Cafeteria roenbergensis]|eukprot:KAA0149702.1 hypothetical protein FNF29_05713 [Cafeteria roenbergensis]
MASGETGPGRDGTQVAQVDDDEWHAGTLEQLISEIENELPVAPRHSGSAGMSIGEAVSMAEEEALAGEPDLLRDTPLRLLGYANEVGEGFRPVAPRFVVPTYAVALGYVVADTVHKYTLAGGDGAAGPQGVSPGLAAADTLVWQLFASVAVPGFIINRAVWFAQQGVEQAGRLPEGLPLRRLLQLPAVRRWLPTAAGLALIPFIVEPVDKFVHRQMDITFRRWFNVPTHFVWGETPTPPEASS